MTSPLLRARKARRDHDVCNVKEYRAQSLVRETSACPSHSALYTPAALSTCSILIT